MKQGSKTDGIREKGRRFVAVPQNGINPNQGRLIDKRLVSARFPREKCPALHHGSTLRHQLPPKFIWRGV